MTVCRTPKWALFKVESRNLFIDSFSNPIIHSLASWWLFIQRSTSHILCVTAFQLYYLFLLFRKGRKLTIITNEAWSSLTLTLSIQPPNTSDQDRIQPILPNVETHSRPTSDVLPKLNVKLRVSDLSNSKCLLDYRVFISGQKDSLLAGNLKLRVHFDSSCSPFVHFFPVQESPSPKSIHNGPQPRPRRYQG